MSADHDKLRVRELEKAIDNVIRQVNDADRGMGSSPAWHEAWSDLKAVRRGELATKTKMVEVWYVEWVYLPPDYPKELKVAVFDSRAEAERQADITRNNQLNEGQWTCIRVTGPHQQEVPT